MSETGPILAGLTARFGRTIKSGSMADPFEVVEVERDVLLDVTVFLKTQRGFDALMDLTAVDYQSFGGPKRVDRFDLVYYLFSFDSRARLRLKCSVSDTDPVAPSLCRLYASANWLEREVWDMFGIRFSGHPDLRRILMYEEFSGHPLRKDYPLTRQQPRIEQDFPGVPPFGDRPKILEGTE